MKRATATMELTKPFSGNPPLAYEIQNTTHLKTPIATMIAAAVLFGGHVGHCPQSRARTGSERMGSNKKSVFKHWVSICNTNHFGIALYVLKALERGLIGWAMTNSTKLVAPLWGAKRMLGTNPIAIGFPGKQEPPIVIDMATSATTYGKIEMARRNGKRIPSGWAIDSEGRSRKNPDDMVEGGALFAAWF